jgi:hypothetical protein
MSYDPRQPPSTPAFRTVPRTGVIYVMHRAAQRGYRTNTSLWSNLGQGAPETGPLAGAPPRIQHLEMDPTSLEYAPVEGLIELREAVAKLYNVLYRQGRRSQYTAENVCIAPGGRAAMTRLAASMEGLNLGHFIPDYTAYEELLFTFRGFIPIPILLRPEQGYQIETEQLRDEIVGRGLRALLLSNPANPTGRVIAGERLSGWSEVARETHCTFIFDEFYSHYVLGSPGNPLPPCVSATAHVEDVDRDPIVVVDGLTKNWRYPGWRLSWIVGPRHVIEQATSAGSFLDGGANHPMQKAALPLLEPEHVEQEARAITTTFRRKCSFMLERLAELGVVVERPPDGAFYAWGNLEKLPPPINDGLGFFEAGLEENVITVPGVFFDVNPGRRRTAARYQNYARFSFGPEQEVLERGVASLARVIARARGQA